MPPRIGLEGQKFNKLTVLSFSHMTKKSQSYWNCICDCGKEKIIRGGGLKNGNVKSCGCISKEIPNNTKHNMTGTLIYCSWRNMIRRCYDFKEIGYYNYGGRGIKVCKRWLTSFINFYSDMGEKPKNKSLDRINNNGNYTPKNCKWSTKKEQQNNRRNNISLTIDKITHTVAEWGRISKINRHVIYKRLRRGWSPKRSVFTNLTKE